MRTIPYAAAAALAAGTMLLGSGPAVAGTASCTVAPYTAVECQTTPPSGVASSGGTQSVPPSGVASTGGTTTPGDPTLPFTGGEFALMALVGVGAVAGGGALVVAGRKRHTGSHAA